MWTPPADAERIITLAISRHRDEMTRAARKAQSEVAERMSASGLGRSGPFYSTINQSRLNLFREFGVKLLADFLATAEDLRWDAQAAHWLEKRYVEVIDATVNGVAQNLSSENERANREAAGRVGVQLKGDAEIAFARARLRRAQPTAPPSRVLSASQRRDVFISHAGEDRADIASPLADELTRRGKSVWFSEFELTLGDSLLHEINRGLVESRYGVVVLSPHFFSKPWPQMELEGLAARSVAENRKVILPIWHRITQEQMAGYAPTLANLLGVETALGVAHVADAIIRALDTRP